VPLRTFGEIEHCVSFSTTCRLPPAYSFSRDSSGFALCSGMTHFPERTVNGPNPYREKNAAVAGEDEGIRY
jgi:hypothetical protein